MKRKFTYIIVFMLAAFSSAYAQDSGEKDYPILTASQSFGQGLDLRINNSHVEKSGLLAIYFNNINFNVRQDYSDHSNYVFSLNPALWGVEYLLTSALNDTSKNIWYEAIPKAVILADYLTNFKLDAYWLHLGWDTDLFLYNKKFIVLFEITIGLKYEYKNWGIAVNYKGTAPHQKRFSFIPPEETNDGLITLALSYNFNSGPVSDFIYLRGAPVEND